jgi:hypothetical protein
VAPIRSEAANPDISSVIRRFHYRPEEKALEIVFVSGRRYRYFHVPQQVYEEMRASSSKGKYFNRHVRDRFSFEKAPIPK